MADYSSSRSSISTEYVDNLDTEPFVEKLFASDPFRDDPDIEQGHPSPLGSASDDEGEGYAVSKPLRSNRKSHKILAVLISIIVLSVLIGALAASGYSVPVFGGKTGIKRITMDHVFNGTFAAYSKSIDWVKEADDGTFSHIDGQGNIVLNTVHDISSDTLLVNSSLVLDLNGDKLRWQSWTLSADMEFVLFKTNHVKQWRHSSFGNYWIHRRKDGVTWPIISPKDKPTITRCTWSPVGHSLAFVSSNDIYILPSSALASANPSPIRITSDGSATIFNGAPDWVYEEEVFESDSALWWSPDAERIAWLRSDESKVKDFKLLYTNEGNDAFEVHQYQTELDMKYPKPGTPNPTVSIHTYTLSSSASSALTLTWPGMFPKDDQIITEIDWVSGSSLLVKEIDRTARKGNVVFFEDAGRKSVGNIVRIMGEDGEEGDKGWIDHGQNIIPIFQGHTLSYLDIIPNPSGYNHIALFSPLNASQPSWVTRGEWEVTEINGVDEENGLIYFTGANPSIDRHIYFISIPTDHSSEQDQSEGVAITDTSSPGYYEASFSPKAGYYVLNYMGPDIPWQRLVEVGSKGEKRGDEENEIGPADILLESNPQLNNTLSEFLRPIVSRSTIESSGHTLNMLEIIPPNLDTTGRHKYPVLIRVYGGPSSQMVTNRFEFDWHYYLASTQKYIVVTIDGRGTGYKGRGLRNEVRDDLGRWEVEDQVAGAREMIKRGYVDRSKIGIWGWSYGGYLTCKTVEADTGVFTLGMAVAPVTNWLFYDSIYTERYLSTPSANPSGYLNSAVNNVTSFSGDKVDFIWAHGSGDDNVHYVNSAALLDRLTQEEVRGWRFRMFTDSNHSMDKRHAYREVYEWMTDFLKEKWGKGGTVHH